jgi:hypothetical protein
MRRRLSCLVALAASLAAAAPAAAQDGEVVTHLDRATPIAAYGDVLAYSVLDPQSGQFRLTIRTGGVATPALVAPRAVPFDVDLGPTTTGGVAAVYSRCAREVLGGGASSADTLYGRGQGCDLYRFDLPAGPERRLDQASSPTASEFWPTIWRDRIAFARTYDNKRNYPYVYTRPAEGGGASVRLPGGARGECQRGRNGRQVCSPQTLSRPAALDLYGKRLAFTWKFSGFAEGLDTEIRLDTIGDGHTRVAAQSGGGLTSAQLGWPAFEDGRLYFDQECSGDPSGCNGRARLSRYRISTGELDRTPAPAAVLSHDRAGATDFLLVDDQPGSACLGDPEVPGGTCELRALQPAFG